MCISRCHIIFWGDKTITNLGITSWNVILWNVNVRAIKWRDMIYFALVATLWRATLEYCNDVYHYEECWIAAVSCMCLRNFQLFRWWIVYIFSKSFLLWRHVLMKHSDVELWTAEMSFQYNVRLMNELHLWIFGYWMNSFIKTLIRFTKWDVIASTIADGTFFVICPSSSSFATWSTNIHHLFIYFDKDFSWNSESCLTTFRVNSDKLCNIMNYDSRLGIILLLWQPILICDYPPIP